MAVTNITVWPFFPPSCFSATNPGDVDASPLPESVIDNARKAEKVQPGRQIAIALDTKVRV